MWRDTNVLPGIVNMLKGHLATSLWLYIRDCQGRVAWACLCLKTKLLCAKKRTEAELDFTGTFTVISCWTVGLTLRQPLSWCKCLLSWESEQLRTKMVSREVFFFFFLCRRCFRCAVFKKKKKSETELTASVLKKKIQNTQKIKRTLFNKTKEDETCKFSR